MPYYYSKGTQSKPTTTVAKIGRKKVQYDMCSDKSTTDYPGFELIGFGKDLNYVLFDKNNVRSPKQYMQNKGLDFNKDGKVTKLEACAAVQRKLAEGLKPENCYE